tara:strand:+ start:667 stop:1050 length:384 start_codon:yes stop_codon:yes gene_type:complete
MKKIYLILILFFSINASANWTEVTRTEGGFSIHYIDFETKKISDDYIKIWELVSYPKKLHQDYDIYSAKNLLLVDCYNKRFKYLVSYYYSGLKGKGNVLEVENSESDWYYDAPGTAGYNELEIICNS